MFRAFSCTFVLYTALALIGAPAAHAQQWQLTDGAARDVGVGADGTVWVISTNSVPGGYGIYKRVNNAWVNIPGGAERIAVDPQGNAWVVNNSNTIFRYDGTKWVTVSGSARDIGVGANGTVWVIGTTAEAGGYGIYRSTDKGANWTKIPGGAVRISVDPQGNAWVVNNANTIFRHDGNQWVTMKGSAADVGIGADGAAWVIGTDSGIYRWEGADWAKKPGGAAQIAAGPNGVVWHVNHGGEIYQAQATAPTGAQVASTTPAGPIGPIIYEGPSIRITPTVTPGTAGTAPAPPPPVRDPTKPFIVFARGYTYEAQILQAIGFQRFKSLVLDAIPPANQLSILEQAMADIALSATESYFAPNPLPPEQAIAKVKNDITARRGVITFMGAGITARVRTARSDAQTVALRQWAGEVFRAMQIATADGVLNEYRRWNRDPCGYENLPAIRCTGYSATISAPRPPQDLIQKNGLGAALSTHADEVAAAVAVGVAAGTIAASAAALASTLGVTVASFSGVAGGAASVVTSTALFTAFGGSAGAGGVATGAIGAVGWAGVAAAPIAAAVAVVVVGTIEGFAVVEAARVEPMLKLKLGAAMTENIVIQNELTSDAGKDFFLLAYAGVAASDFNIPPNTVDGEVRFFCQAGYVSRFKLTYQVVGATGVAGATQTKQTKDLSVGYEETFPIPARATNIVASGEWWNGSSWQSLFTRNLPRPTFIGFTSYGTIFAPAYKDEYPEISNVQGAANKLTVTHGGGYVAWIRVEYTQGGNEIYRADAPAATSVLTWTRTDGAARDVGVGADGTVWVIGTNAVGGGYGIYRRTNNTWVNIPGGAERIAVDPQGNAWVVNSTQTIFRYDGSKWVTVNGAARDIGVGANGTVWVIGNNAEAGGYGIYRSTDKGASWTKVPGSAVRISVDPSGNAWVVNNANNIFRFDGSNWAQQPGAATDIGIGADGAVWVIGTDSGIYRWEGSNWVKKPGGATQIAAGPNGAVWVVNQGRSVRKVEVKDATLGWRQEVDIPTDATNIRLVAWSQTGLVWDPEETIIDKTWPSPQAACIKFYNTATDPKWNNECR